MPSKYSRFLLSTCLPAAALSFYMTPPVQAGFEWTPPTEIEESLIVPATPPAPVPQESLPAPIAEAPAPVVEETIPAPIESVIPEPIENIEKPTVETPISEQAPTNLSPVKPAPLETEVEQTTIEVLEQPAIPSIKSQEEILIKIPEDPQPQIDVISNTPQLEEMPEKISEENITEKIEEAIAEEIVPPVVEPQKAEIIEIVEPIAEEKNKPQVNEMPTINPFPLSEDDAQAQPEKTAPIALPSDSEETLTDITIDDVLTTEDISPEETEQAPEPEAIIWNTPEAFDVIEGFGADMPLALALGQIAPARYAYSFGTGVNPGSMISWEGGKPWNEVLDNALTPLNISYEIQDKTIHLKAIKSPLEETNEEIEVKAKVETNVENEVNLAEEETDQVESSAPSTPVETANVIVIPEKENEDITTAPEEEITPSVKEEIIWQERPANDTPANDHADQHIQETQLEKPAEDIVNQTLIEQTHEEANVVEPPAIEEEPEFIEILVSSESLEEETEDTTISPIEELIDNLGDTPDEIQAPNNPVLDTDKKKR